MLSLRRRMRHMRSQFADSSTPILRTDDIYALLRLLEVELHLRDYVLLAQLSKRWCRVATSKHMLYAGDLRALQCSNRAKYCTLCASDASWVFEVSAARLTNVHCCRCQRKVCQTCARLCANKRELAQVADILCSPHADVAKAGRARIAFSRPIELHVPRAGPARPRYVPGVYHERCTTVDIYCCECVAPPFNKTHVKG